MGRCSEIMLSAFCVLLLSGSVLPTAPSVPRLPRAAPAERWLEIISEYARERIDAERLGRPGWMPKPFPVSLPVGTADGRSTENLPILVLPVPVHVDSKECSVNQVQTSISTNVQSDINNKLYEVPQPRPFGFGGQNVKQTSQYKVSTQFDLNKPKIQNVQISEQKDQSSGSLDQLVQKLNAEEPTQKPFVNKPFIPVQKQQFELPVTQIPQKLEGIHKYAVKVEELNVPQKPTFEFRPFSQFSQTKTPVAQTQFQFNQIPQQQPSFSSQFQSNQAQQKQNVNFDYKTFETKPFQPKLVQAPLSPFNYKPFEVKPVQQKPVEVKPFEQKSFVATSEEQKPAKPVEQKPIEQKPFVEQKPFEFKQVEPKPFVAKPVEYKPFEQKTLEFKSVEQKPFDFKPFVQKPLEFKSVEQKPFEFQPVEQKPFEFKPVEQKPFEFKPVEQKPFEFKPVEQKPFEFKPQQQQIAPQQINYNPQLINSFVQNQPTPNLEAVVSSEYLLEQFRSQQPQAPHLPPAVIDNREVVSADEEPPYPSAAGPFEYQTQHQVSKAQPSRPRWPRSLHLNAFLTVPRADYTEPYAMWYDGETGASRVELHGGSTVTYKTPLPNGQFQRIEMRLDNSGDAPVRRCNVAPPAPLAPAELQAPGLPNLEEFDFTGFVKEKGLDAEKWTRVVKTLPGSGGGANGEVLTYTHTVLLYRLGEFAKPLEYSVSVDSSVLGPACDGYTHTYTDVVGEQHKPELFTLNADVDCEERWAADPTHLDQLAALEPLREFTLPTRDPRYDDAFVWFKKTFERDYVDDKEEAIRKNLLVQSTRFCNSGNREGATFELGVNFLGDRLDSELAVLLGVKVEEENIPAEKFPHSSVEIAKDDKELPDDFDWREKGGVTPARYQGSCSSCWAFAVTAAVEGALFIKTDNLVPLAEQHLVDCGHTHGTHGCQGTWPSFAYDYIQDKGIPSLAEYGAHKEKVETCRQVPPVTHISAHVNVTKNSVPALKVAINKHAPTVVVIDAKAKSFIYYKKGVLQDKRCGKSKMPLNHAVTAVGWGTKTGKVHFIIKNSWSAAWGEDGFARLEGPTNTCGVLSLPSYPRLEKENVDRLPGGSQSKA